MRRYILYTFIIGILFIAAGPLGYGQVNIKMAVVNSSENEARTVPVRYELPAGLKKEDILDSGPLKADYDIDKGVYYVYGNIELAPKESKTIQISLRDIWQISEEEIEDLISILEDSVDSIEEEDKHEVAGLIAESIKERLESILQAQEELSGDIEKRMQMYSVQKEKIAAIKDEIFSLEHLVELGEPEAKTAETVVLAIEAENTLDKKVDIPLEYYLPKEIIPEYIVDAGPFDINYDSQRGQFYLKAQQVFQPGEKKRFNIEVKNVWNISEELVDKYVQEADQLNGKLVNSEFETIAGALFNEIDRKAGQIKSLQQQAESVKDHIANYRINQRRFDLVKSNLEKMRSLASKVKEEQKISKKKPKISNVLREMEYLSAVKKMSDTLFKRLRRVAIWKVIMTVVIFIIGITIFFYTIWFLKLKKEEKQKYEKIGDEEGIEAEEGGQDTEEESE